VCYFDTHCVLCYLCVLVFRFHAWRWCITEQSARSFSDFPKQWPTKLAPLIASEQLSHHPFYVGQLKVHLPASPHSLVSCYPFRPLTFQDNDKYRESYRLLHHGATEHVCQKFVHAESVEDYQLFSGNTFTSVTQLHWTNIFCSSLDSQNMTSYNGWKRWNDEKSFKKILDIWAYQHQKKINWINKVSNEKRKPKKYKTIVASEQRNAHHTEHPVAEILKFYYWWLLFGQSAGWNPQAVPVVYTLNHYSTRNLPQEACLQTWVNKEPQTPRFILIGEHKKHSARFYRPPRGL